MELLNKHNDISFISYIMQNLILKDIKKLENLGVSTHSFLDLYPVLKSLVDKFILSYHNNAKNTEYECIENFLASKDHLKSLCSCDVLDLNYLEVGTFSLYNMPTILDDEGNEVILDEYLIVWCKLNKHIFDGRYVYLNQA